MALAVAGIAACGGDDDPVQTTAPAVTGAEDIETDAGADPMAEATTGADSEPAPEGTAPVTDREAISRTLDRVLVDATPADACETLVTERYVRSAFGGMQACEQAQAPKAAAADIDVSRVVVAPEAHAQAAVRAKGGVYDGQRLRAELVLVDGVWRLDSLSSNVPVGP